MSLPLIDYPYLPDGCAHSYVKEENPFMAAAKAAAGGHGCRKHATGAVAVKDGQIIISASNAGIHVPVCPRQYKGYKTGEGYRYCQSYCEQISHPEVIICRIAKEQGIDLSDAEIYLYGHWWVCNNCWKHLLEAGVRHVYLLEGSEKLFNVDHPDYEYQYQNKPLSLYVSGALTKLANQNIKQLYEEIGRLGKEIGFSSYVPHLKTDPIKMADISAEEVYDTDSTQVKAADLMICYVGELSLGVGMEIALAREHKSLVILLSERGTKISRMVLGSPAVIDHIEFDNFDNALAQLKTAMLKFKQVAEQKNISI